MVEVVLILQNSSLKLKTVVDNAILLNYAVSSENIFQSIKTKAENVFIPNPMSAFSAELKTAQKNSHTANIHQVFAPLRIINMDCLRQFFSVKKSQQTRGGKVLKELF